MTIRIPTYNCSWNYHKRAIFILLSCSLSPPPNVISTPPKNLLFSRKNTFFQQILAYVKKKQYLCSRKGDCVNSGPPKRLVRFGESEAPEYFNESVAKTEDSVGVRG